MSGVPADVASAVLPATGRIRRTAALGDLPPVWPVDPSIDGAAASRPRGEKLVVLDDDPTGCQTVHGIPVLMDWSVDGLAAALAGPEPAFYVLTNSRSLPADEAAAVNKTVGRLLLEAAARTGTRFSVVSRSDSTLRGHFPAELFGLAEGLGRPFDAWLVLPFFEEGGRYTIGDVHYVQDGEWLVPAGETDFARDASFGYRASNLRHWVEEKSLGVFPSADVASISIDDLRTGGPDRVRQRLLALPRGSVCVVNAAAARDMEVFVAGLVAAEGEGDDVRRYLCRTAASFVPVRAGLRPRPLLQPAELGLGDAGTGGLVVVGSHIPRSTAQLRALEERLQPVSLVLPVQELLSGDADACVRRTAAEMNAALAAGKTVVVSSSRDLVTGRDAGESLAMSRRVSAALVAVVRGLSRRPRWFLAKGGITSHDMAMRGLDVRRAEVLGQLQAGVPVWRLGPESRFPGLPYVVFPGNVGTVDAIADAVTALSAEGAGPC